MSYLYLLKIGSKSFRISAPLGTYGYVATINRPLFSILFASDRFNLINISSLNSPLASVSHIKICPFFLVLRIH